MKHDREVFQFSSLIYSVRNIHGRTKGPAGSEEFPAFEVEADRAPTISKSPLRTRSKDGLCLLLYHHYTDIITEIIIGNYSLGGIPKVKT